jgi:archaellum component FlaC
MHGSGVIMEEFIFLIARLVSEGKEDEAREELNKCWEGCLDEIKQLKAERTEAWKQRNEMKEKVVDLEAYIKEHVTLCSECEDPIKPEEDTCVSCAWKLKHQ